MVNELCVWHVAPCYEFFRLSRYSEDTDRKFGQMVKEMKSQGSGYLAREVLLIKSQLEDMNTCLRELSVIVKGLAERPFGESPVPTSRKKTSRGSRTTPTQQNFTPEPTHETRSEVQVQSISISRQTAPFSEGNFLMTDFGRIPAPPLATKNSSTEESHTFVKET